MLGGSASPHQSGAPFRPGSVPRTTTWPPPAHQNDIFNRSYGIYSLFPGPGDPAGALYTPTAKIAHTGNSFQGLAGGQKVSDSFFSSKFTFEPGVPSRYEDLAERGISQLELMTKTFNQTPKPYSPTKKKPEKQEISAGSEPRSKRLSDDVVIIKSERDDVNKRQGESEGSKEGEKGGTEERDAKERRKIDDGENGMSHILSNASEPRATGADVNEPDSTDFGIHDGNHKPNGVIASGPDPPETNSTKPEPESYETCSNFRSYEPTAESSTEEESDGKDAKSSNKVEKCNVNVIDLSIENSDKCDKKKTAEKCVVKSETINDICNRLSEKKCTKTKVTDSGSKFSPQHCKQIGNESSKPSPTRTLTLPPHNGGCSRTTPVTFKHSLHPDPEPKHPTPMSIEVPQLYIKKEPTDFRGGAFLSPNRMDNYLSPNGLRVLDTQLLSPGRYSDSYPSPSRRNESYLSPSLDHNFLSPRMKDAFLGPRTPLDNPFLSPNIDIESYDSFKNFRLPKVSDGYLINGNAPKMQDGIYMSGEDEVRRSQESSLFLSPTSTTNVDCENESKVNKNNCVSAASVTPCQVAEVTSATSMLSPKHGSVNPLIVKQESAASISVAATSTSATTTEQKKEIPFMPSATGSGSNIPVGIAVARQRCQRHTEVKLSPTALPQPVMHRTVQPSASIDLSSAMGAAVYSGGVACDDRSTNLITSWSAQPHNPTLWQYSAAPIDYPPFPPVGLQLVRDPMTGHLLLIPAANIEALQRAILWPSYQPSAPQMIIPPMPVPPTTQHLLLDTSVPAVDFLSPDTMHHNAPQHRILITTDNAKRKMPAPTVIKLETTDCANTVVVTTCDNNSIYTKAQPISPTPGHEPIFYPQRPSGASESGRRSQATSPVSCLTPVPESHAGPIEPEEASTEAPHPTMVTLQDASNQTETPLQSEDETSQPETEDKFEPYTKVTEQPVKLLKTTDVGTETNIPVTQEPIDDKKMILNEIQKRKDVEESLKIHISNVPHFNIKEEIISPPQVDISGLELLSNSIEQFVCERKTDPIEDACEEPKDLSNDACEGAVLLQSLKNGFRKIEPPPIKFETKPPESKHLGGLGLLCALAEQRFREEVENEEEKEVAKEQEQEEESEEEKPERKACDLNSNYQNRRERNSITSWESLGENRPPEDGYNMDAMETDMRLRLAELQRKYKEKQRELNNLSPKLIDTDTSVESPKRGPGRPKKIKSVSKILDTPPTSPHSRRLSRKSKEMSPPILEKATDYSYDDDDDEMMDLAPKLKSKVDILRPPTLTPNTVIDPVCKSTVNVMKLPQCNVNLVPLAFDEEGQPKLKDEVEVTKQKPEEETKKRKLSADEIPLSSSKKRKVGRPKKNFLSSGGQNPLTETIVAKKPKSKPTNYHFQPIQGAEPAKETLSLTERKKLPVRKPEPGSESEVLDDKKCRKIRPKLKAEAKLKEWAAPEEEENIDWGKSVKTEEVQIKVKSEGKSLTDSAETRVTVESAKKSSNLPSCLLTADHLESDKLPIRTLTAMGGLFYAGQLSAIRAPDVYGITIDGERGHRPHIFSREEILKDSILEVKPGGTCDLIPGTRLCAYWSEQYRCLYPGTVSAPTTPDPELDDKFVNVEFDDGDSGRINIEDIRLLPGDYPIIEYDPNPLQSLSKRKRRISGASVESHSKERKVIDFSPEKNEKTADDKAEGENEETEPKKTVGVFESGGYLSPESERRHLKKKRREKLKRLQSLSVDGKKKHKKHRCSEEHRHHRHHKKHRKHRHKHGKRHGDDTSSSDVKTSEEKPEVVVKAGSKEKNEEPLKKKAKKNKCKSVEKSCRLSDKSKTTKPKKCKERTESVESRSKMAAFLPARQLWGWCGKGYKRPGAKGRAKKEFYKTIQRGKERITVGDCAVFLSTGRPDRPYIGRIESMWESWGTNMIVKVKWFYHPEETVGCPATLEYPGALFESPHVDENDVQTISHKCEVLRLKEYTEKLGNEPHRYETIYDNNDIYYLAGYYDPTNTTLKMEPGVK